MNIKVEPTENFGLSPEQLANLKTLAMGLAAHVPPPEFDMNDYVTSDGYGASVTILENYPHKFWNQKERYAKCGTVACAVGHGPMFGIEPRIDEYWHDYSHRSFGCNPYVRKSLFVWMFGTDWSIIDNTPQGAAARINFFLEKGLPFNYDLQASGAAPLCYEVNEIV